MIMQQISHDLIEARRLLRAWMSRFESRSYTSIRDACVFLNESMHLQVLIDPQRIEGRRIKACQEHIHHNQNINLPFLHPLRYIFIIILELR